MFIAQQKDGPQDGGEQITSSIWNYFLLDAFWTQYMQALGEYGDAPANFDEHQWKYYLYVLFFVITFIT